MNTIRTLLVAVLICVAAVPLAAAIEGAGTVGQRGRQFSTFLVRVHRGEPVTFVNDDTVPHNIMSASRNNQFDMGAQAPGTAVPVTFDELGRVDVICAIHPRMRMVIEIAE